MTLLVKAEVVDIRSHNPSPGDAFFVDTNVWKWVAYTKASLPPVPPPAAITYPAFIQRVRANGGTLLHCGLSLSEISNIIERAEFEQYARANALSSAYQHKKDFRRNPVERAKLTAEISAAWGLIEALSSCASLTVDAARTTACLSRLQNSPIDAYDAFFVEAACACGVPRIVTDDTDFCSVPQIRVFTGHPFVIYSAKIAGKLIKP